MNNDLIKAAAQRRAKRNAPERKLLRAYNRTVAEIEALAHRGAAAVATGQTLARSILRLNEVPLTRLKRTNRLNVWELTAADEILHAYGLSAGQTSGRDPDLGFGGGTVRADAADTAAVSRIDTLDKFREWRTDLKQTEAMAAVVAVLLDEKSLRTVEKENRWRNGTAFGHFQAGLRHFAALRGNVPRGERWLYERKRAA